MAMTATAPGSIFVARSLPDALAALADRGSTGAAFAGGTWIMRAPIRHEPLAIGRIAELTAVTITSETIEIGAAVTHTALAAALDGLPEFAALTTAASSSANPAVRSAATIGGNLATTAFAAADCVPALLCLDADVEISSLGGRERISLERFLGIRSTLAPGHLLTRIIVPRNGRSSAHIRLPLRKAGDYPVAIVSLAISCGAAARIAVGSIEPVARRWERLEAALIGHPIAPERLAQLAKDSAADFIGRDSVEVPAWYRLSVLPTLVRRAATAVLAGA